MKKKERIAVITVTGLFLFYCLLLFTNSLIELAYAIFFASPFLVAWMMYAVVKNGSYTGKELNEDEEWGYGDKQRNELDLF
jgi:hypothetical protein